MTTQIRAFVTLDESVEAESVAHLLPPDEDVHVLGYGEGMERSRDALDGTAADLVIVACAADSRDAIALIAHAAQQRPERPIVVFQMGAAESNGFMHDVFASGADDIVLVGQTNRRALLRGASGGLARVHEVGTREEAVAWVRRELKAGDVVLYENDLPDHYP